MNELQGRLPHIEARKDALISARTFEQYARLVRNMSVIGGTLGVNGLGGIEIAITPSQGGAASGYAGPFALTDEGVSAGLVIIQNANGQELMTYDVPSRSYGSMLGTVSTGYVSLIVIYSPPSSTPNYVYYISSDIPDATGASLGIVGWLYVIGYWNGTATTQYHYGNAYAWYSGNTYAGPFALTPGSGACYIEPGIIFCGTTTLTTNRWQTSFSPSTSLYVLLTITYSNSSYHAALSTSSSYSPSQSASSYIVPLGRIHDGIIEQWQHGPVYMAGRVA